MEIKAKGTAILEVNVNPIEVLVNLRTSYQLKMHNYRLYDNGEAASRDYDVSSALYSSYKEGLRKITGPVLVEKEEENNYENNPVLKSYTTSEEAINNYKTICMLM